MRDEAETPYSGRTRSTGGGTGHSMPDWKAEDEHEDEQIYSDHTRKILTSKLMIISQPDLQLSF